MKQLEAFYEQVFEIREEDPRFPLATKGNYYRTQFDDGTYMWSKRSHGDERDNCTAATEIQLESFMIFKLDSTLIIEKVDFAELNQNRLSVWGLLNEIEQLLLDVYSGRPIKGISWANIDGVNALGTMLDIWHDDKYPDED